MSISKVMSEESILKYIIGLAVSIGEQDKKIEDLQKSINVALNDLADRILDMPEQIKTLENNQKTITSLINALMGGNLNAPNEQRKEDTTQIW